MWASSTEDSTKLASTARAWFWRSRFQNHLPGMEVAVQTESWDKVSSVKSVMLWVRKACSVRGEAPSRLGSSAQRHNICMMCSGELGWSMAWRRASPLPSPPIWRSKSSATLNKLLFLLSSTAVAFLIVSERGNSIISVFAGKAAWNQWYGVT